MTFRIQRAVADGVTVLTLSGEIAAGHEPELRDALDAQIGPQVVLDLKGLRVVDGDGVQLLREFEARGTRLTNCPGYVRTWINSEAREDGMTVTDVGVAREARVTSTGGVSVFSIALGGPPALRGPWWPSCPASTPTAATTGGSPGS